MTTPSDPSPARGWTDGVEQASRTPRCDTMKGHIEELQRLREEDGREITRLRTLLAQAEGERDRSIARAERAEESVGEYETTEAFESERARLAIEDRALLAAEVDRQRLESEGLGTHLTPHSAEVCAALGRAKKGAEDAD